MLDSLGIYGSYENHLDEDIGVDCQAVFHCWEYNLIRLNWITYRRCY